ncbi:hypothetical protein CDL15_Pgr005136 [Punica granatum]|uniref:Uncharacterized protein n=1 Tax=Punica granatum TaxID=22663 RepID=A0A218WNX0_PUNGR|nr:hypothetical protein CDL15_Pgr005136 [Punica granatum]PKI61506.1 hypothetical protein CRG98_018090 [Punica granatum]
MTIKDTRGPDQDRLSGHGLDPSRDRSLGRTKGAQSRWWSSGRGTKDSNGRIGSNGQRRKEVESNLGARVKKLMEIEEGRRTNQTRDEGSPSDAPAAAMKDLGVLGFWEKGDEEGEYEGCLVGRAQNIMFVGAIIWLFCENRFY